MFESRKEIDAQIERASGQIQNSRPDDDAMSQAAARVLERLTSNVADQAADAAAVEEIRGCEDYQRLIPAYLSDALPTARKLLVEDHTRECLPCRKALNAARRGETAAPETPRSRRPATTSRPILKWAIAALLLAGIGAAQIFFWDVLPGGDGTRAVVKTVDGQLFRVASTSHLPLAVGDEISRGEVVRTGRDHGAVMELADGSLIELRSRSEISLSESRRGTTIQLERGSVIVQAAEQRERHLYVATDDCLVSVTGTIFSVNHGTKGSRVAVIEGEVRVQHDGTETVLEPGQQVATQARLDPVPVEREIAWSRDVDRYLELLGELSDLRDELGLAVAHPELRYASRLLDLMPDGTVFFAAVPNLGETFTTSYQVIRQRIGDSPMLSEWWQAHGGHQLQPEFDDAVDKIAQLTGFLGEEMAVGGQLGGAEPDSFAGPLVLAEVVDAAGLRDFVAQLELPGHGNNGPNFILVEDPLTPPGGDSGSLLLWIGEELLIATPRGEQMREVASFVLDNQANPFTDSDFHDQIAQLYQEGAGLLAAVDLEAMMAHNLAADDESTAQHGEILERLGLRSLRHLMAEHKRIETTTEDRAVLTFNEARSGVASWLAVPSPMGSLELISPDAKLFGAVVFEDPVKMLDDLEGFLDDGPNDLRGLFGRFEERYGVDFRADLAAVLGGELAFAIDGPLLPEPAWKLILEVYDSARFQWTLEQGLAELNHHLTEDGQEPIEILDQEIGGRTFYTLSTQPVMVSYTFVAGYLVAAPNIALLDRAIRYHDSGYSVARAPRFTALLPNDGRNNFSALVYQDLGQLMQAVAEQLGQGQLTPEQQQTLDDLQERSTASLGYAYAEDERIIAAATSEGDMLTSLLLRLAGIENPVGFEALFEILGRSAS